MDTLTAHLFSFPDGKHVVIGRMEGTRFCVTVSLPVTGKVEARAIARTHKAMPYNF
jgi:hypothetical protein